MGGVKNTQWETVGTENFTEKVVKNSTVAEMKHKEKRATGVLINVSPEIFKEAPSQVLMAGARWQLLQRGSKC